MSHRPAIVAHQEMAAGRTVRYCRGNWTERSAYKLAFENHTAKAWLQKFGFWRINDDRNNQRDSKLCPRCSPPAIGSDLRAEVQSAYGPFLSEASPAGKMCRGREAMMDADERDKLKGLAAFNAIPMSCQE
jgi:hypothetical protein